MAETPPTNEAFFREVDDAVRQDRLLGFWTRFGRWIAGAVVLGLAAFGGWLYWQHQSRQDSGEVAEKAYEMLRTVSTGGKADEGALRQLAAADQPGYRVMATLTRAGVAARDGKIDEAAKLYGEVAADAQVAQPYRDLATVRMVALNFDKLPPQQVVERLRPLAAEGNPWFGSAGEITAIAYMKMGKQDVAGPIFATIAKDESVPATVRSRARQMAGLLGVDAVILEEDGNAETGTGNAASGA